MGEGEHRCRRCGRRPEDTLEAEIAIHRTDGALAAQVRMAPAEVASPPQPPRNYAGAVQRRLVFQDQASNVISFDAYAPPRVERRRESKVEKGARPAARRAPRVSENQGSLDFLPALTAKPRTLSTTVEAVIYCEAPVATRLHRAVAASLDWSMVLIAWGLFLLVFKLAGGSFVLSRPNLFVFAASLGLMAFTYGLVWAIAGSETAGMHWARLRLITFDGFPPEPRQRLLRFGGSCLSLCTVLGLLWSLGDEESLTWQDHISRTFPTPLESESQVFNRR
jgi:uncharacterized RDD family membrane protein YckC